MKSKYRNALVACLTAILSCGAADPGYAELVNGYPDALICELPKAKLESKFVLYLHTVQKDGSAIYMDLGRNYVTLKKDGTILRNNKPIEGCAKHVF